MSASLFGALLASCTNSTGSIKGTVSEAEPTEASRMREAGKFAHIVAPEVVDMGVFNHETPKKTTEIEIGNTGEALLHIKSVLSQCECTQILSVDSVLRPGEKGTIVVSMDLSKYLADTIYKQINVISSDPERHVLPIELMGDCRM